jgi:hypothetical protein
MRCLHLSRAWVALATLGVLLGALTASAKNGRDFGGMYSIVNTVNQGGDQVLVTLRVQLFNHSDADVSQAVVTLRENGGGPLGTFQPVKLWRNHAQVRLTQQFVVPKHELQNWQKGAQPTLMVVTRDANGQRYDRFVQMSRRAALPR